MHHPLRPDRTQAHGRRRPDGDSDPGPGACGALCVGARERRHRCAARERDLPALGSHLSLSLSLSTATATATATLTYSSYSLGDKLTEVARGPLRVTPDALLASAIRVCDLCCCFFFLFEGYLWCCWIRTTTLPWALCDFYEGPNRSLLSHVHQCAGVPAAYISRPRSSQTCGEQGTKGLDQSFGLVDSVMGLPGTWSPSPAQGSGCFNLGLSVYIPWVTTVARAVILKPKGKKKSNLNLKSSRVRNLSDRSAQSCYSFPGSFFFFFWEDQIKLLLNWIYIPVS